MLFVFEKTPPHQPHLWASFSPIPGIRIWPIHWIVTNCTKYFQFYLSLLPRLSEILEHMIKTLLSQTLQVLFQKLYTSSTVPKYTILHLNERCINTYTSMMNYDQIQLPCQNWWNIKILCGSLGGKKNLKITNKNYYLIGISTVLCSQFPYLHLA